MSKIPEEPDIEAWLSGELSREEALAFERKLEESDSCEIWEESEDLTGFEPVSHSPDVTGLIEVVKARGASGLLCESETERWREFVSPPEDSSGVIGRIGNYDLLEVIAVGGMGVVLKARDPDLSRIAAVKMIAPGLVGNANACERFLREARAAARLEHENILPIYGVHHDPVPHFAMRYASGGTLQDKVGKNGRLNFPETRSIGLQIAAALEKAHGDGIIHRDIKPANILFDDDGKKLWVCDFGIARSVEDPALTYAGVIAGTPQFMSPEQAGGRKLDERSDLFSLGAVLYFCSFGKPPFDGTTTISLLKSVSTADEIAVRQGEFPLWFRRLVENLLAANPDDRPGSAGEVIDLIKKETSPKSNREKRSRRRLLLGSGAVSAGLLAGAGLWRRRDLLLPMFETGSFDSHRPPRIAIRETGEEFASFGELFGKVTDGATIELEGRLVCDRQYDGPEGVELHFVAGRGGATVVSSHSQFALVLNGAATFRNIRFIRENWSPPLKPILGIAAAGKQVRLENCLFRSRPVNEEEFAGDGFSITDCSHVEILGCKFDLPSGTAVLLVCRDIGDEEMRVDISRSVFVSQIAFFRRNVEEVKNQQVNCLDSIFVTDYLMVDSYRNRFYPWSVTFQGCLVDCRRAVYFDADIEPDRFFSGSQWKSGQSIFREGVPFLVTNGGSDRVPPVEEPSVVKQTMIEFLGALKDSQSVDDQIGIPLDWENWAAGGYRMEELRTFVPPAMKGALDRVLRIIPESRS